MSKEKLEMINLLDPSGKNGVGTFFAVCLTAINKCNWNRADFDAVKLAEGQLSYLEKYCLQEFGKAVQETPMPQPTKPQTESSPQTESKPVKKEEKKEEIIDPNDKNRKVPMPDSILTKVMAGVEAAKAMSKDKRADLVKVEPLPKTKAEYEQVF